MSIFDIRGGVIATVAMATMLGAGSFAVAEDAPPGEQAGTTASAAELSAAPAAQAPAQNPAPVAENPAPTAQDPAQNPAPVAENPAPVVQDPAPAPAADNPAPPAESPAPADPAVPAADSNNPVPAADSPAPADPAAPAQESVQATPPAASPVCKEGAPERLLISEYNSAEDFTHRAVTAPSFIKLYNPMTKPMDLTGYSLRTSVGGPFENSAINLQGTIQPCSGFLIGLRHFKEDAETSGKTWPVPNLMSDLYVGRFGGVALVLGTLDKPLNQEGVVIIDKVAFDTAKDIAEGAPVVYFGTDQDPINTDGKYLVRKDPNVDTDRNDVDFHIVELTPEAVAQTLPAPPAPTTTSPAPAGTPGVETVTVTATPTSSAVPTAAQALVVKLKSSAPAPVGNPYGTAVDQNSPRVQLSAIPAGPVGASDLPSVD